jgi:TPR repeat protein
MHISRAPLAALALLLIAAPAWSGDFQKGLDAYNSADYETALSEWTPLAEAGDVGGQYGLGLMYGNGFGVDMDDALAVKWYGLAAEQGHALAQNNLAVMHQNGWGVPQNDQEAVRLYALAAEQGVVEAMVALGRYYAMDFCEDYNPVEAYKWYSVAAKFDAPDANAKRDYVAEKMTLEQVTEGENLVELWSSDHSSLLAKK